MKRQIPYCDRCRRESPFLLEVVADGRPWDVCPGCAVAMTSEFPRTEFQELVLRKPSMVRADVIRYKRPAEG